MPTSLSLSVVDSSIQGRVINPELRQKFKIKTEQKSPPSRESISEALAIVRARKQARESPDRNSKVSFGDEISSHGTNELTKNNLNCTLSLSPRRLKYATGDNNSLTSFVPHYTTPTSASIACRYRKEVRNDFSDHYQLQQQQDTESNVTGASVRSGIYSPKSSKFNTIETKIRKPSPSPSSRRQLTRVEQNNITNIESNKTYNSKFENDLKSNISTISKINEEQQYNQQQHHLQMSCIKDGDIDLQDNQKILHVAKSNVKKLEQPDKEGKVFEQHILDPIQVKQENIETVNYSYSPRRLPLERLAAEVRSLDRVLSQQGYCPIDVPIADRIATLTSVSKSKRKKIVYVLNKERINSNGKLNIPTETFEKTGDIISDSSVMSRRPLSPRQIPDIDDYNHISVSSNNLQYLSEHDENKKFIEKVDDNLASCEPTLLVSVQKSLKENDNFISLMNEFPVQEGKSATFNVEQERANLKINGERNIGDVNTFNRKDETGSTNNCSIDKKTIFNNDLESDSLMDSLSEDDILLDNLQPQMLKEISGCIDSLALNRSIDRIKEVEIIQKSDQFEENNKYSNILPIQNVKYTDEQTKIPNINTMALAVNGECIESVVERHEKSEDQLAKPLIVEGRSMDQPIVVHVKNNSSYMNNINPIVRSSMASMMNSESLNTVVDNTPLYMGAKSQIMRDDYEFDPFSSELNSSSSESLLFISDDIHPKTLEAIGDYIDNLTATKVLEHKQKETMSLSNYSAHEVGQDLHEEIISQVVTQVIPHMTGYQQNLLLSSDKSETAKLEKEVEEKQMFIEELNMHEDPLITRLLLYANKTNTRELENEVDEKQMFIVESNTHEDPLIIRLRKGRESDDSILLAQKHDDPSAQSPFSYSSATENQEDSFVKERKAAAFEATSLIPNLTNISVPNLCPENSCEMNNYQRPVDLSNEVQSLKQVERIKQLLTERRVMISNEEVDLESIGSNSNSSLVTYDVPSINVEAIDAIRDYIDIVHYTKSKTISGNISDTLKVSDFGRVTDDLYQQVAPTDPSTQYSSSDLAKLNKSAHGGSNLIPKIEESLLNPYPLNIPKEDPPAQIETQSSITCGSTGNVSNGGDLFDEDHSLTNVEQSSLGQYTFLSSRLFDSRLSPIVDATDEDSGTNKQSTIKSDPVDDASTMMSLSQTISLNNLSGDQIPDMMSVPDVRSDSKKLNSRQNKLSIENESNGIDTMGASIGLSTTETEKVLRDQQSLLSFMTDSSHSNSLKYMSTGSFTVASKESFLSICDLTEYDDKSCKPKSIINNDETMTLHKIECTFQNLQTESGMLPTIDFCISKNPESHTKLLAHEKNCIGSPPCSGSIVDTSVCMRMKPGVEQSKQDILRDHTISAISPLVSEKEQSLNEVVDRRDASNDLANSGHSEEENDQNNVDCTEFDEAIFRLIPLLTGSMYKSQTAVNNFATLVRFAFPFLVSKQSGAFVVALILSEAQKLEIPLHSVDRLLDTSNTLARKTYFDYSTMTEEEKILLFLNGLITIAESKYGSVETDDPILTEVLSFIDKPSFCVESEAIEIDLNNGFVNKKNEPTSNHEESSCAQSSKFKYGNIIDRDTDSSVQLKKNISAHVDDNMKGSHQDVIRSVEDDIEQYWKDRDTKQKMKRNLNNQITQVPASYSVEGSLLGESRSLFTHSTGTDSIHESYSNSADSADSADSSILRNRRVSKKSSDRSVPSQSRWNSQGYTTRVHEQKSINAVKAASSLIEDGAFVRSREKQNFPKVWKQSYVGRTQNHLGFLDVDIHSLYDSTHVHPRTHLLDCKPWEHRLVKQRFLDDQSLSFNRNWFGSLSVIHGNDKIKEPVCKVKSMEMPMKAEGWSKAWYKKEWAAPLPSNLSGSFGMDCHQLEKGSLSAPRYPQSLDDEDDDESWEEIPECGKLKNLRLKPGDRITRVTPDLTSYLRRSRWRKKHFPQGTCPYK